MYVVQAVVSAPIVVYVLHIAQAVAGAAAHVGHKHREAVEGEELDKGHGEPGEIRALLALRPTMDIIDHRARPLETPV